MANDTSIILRECKATTDFPTVVQLLRTSDPDNWATRQMVAAGNHIAKTIDKPDVKLALLSSFTLDLLPAHCSFQSGLAGIKCSTLVAPYNQYLQQLVTPGSECQDFDPDIIVVAIGLREIAPRVVFEFGSLTPVQREQEAERIFSHVVSVVDAALSNLRSTVLLCNHPLPTTLSLGVADGHDPASETAFYYNLNLKLHSHFQSSRRAHVLDVTRLAAAFGSDRVFDRKMYYLAKMNWSEAFYPAVARELVRHVIAHMGWSKKCLVVDLDNTLWGGILGEEGPMGVQVGQGDSIAEAFHETQLRIKNLKNRGILLGICSKNNQSDVDEVFEKRPEMPLAAADFVTIQANWEPKHTNMDRIAAALNIGMESIVFLDDNPAECALMQQMRPEVSTVQMPVDPEKGPALIEELVYFEKSVMLAEDFQKTQQYQENQKREITKVDSTDLHAWLTSLETILQIVPAHPQQAERVHQLFSKTNQFNVTTIRYSAAEIDKFITDPGWDLTLVSARDIFGDLGVIGLYLVERLADHARIDSFVMSCRALGRSIETAAMNHLKQTYLIDGFTSRLDARFCQTAKNQPATSFFIDQGFQTASTSSDVTEYFLETDRCELLDCEWITVSTTRI